MAPGIGTDNHDHSVRDASKNSRIGIQHEGWRIDHYQIELFSAPLQKEMNIGGVKESSRSGIHWTTRHHPEPGSGCRLNEIVDRKIIRRAVSIASQKRIGKAVFIRHAENIMQPGPSQIGI